jgi:hypothetical protein
MSTLDALVVPATQKEVLLQALADAVYYRDPPAECRVCEVQAELCDGCAAGLAWARAYLALGRELGVDTLG